MTDSALPPSSSRFRLAMPYLTCAVLCGVVLWILWGPVLRSMLDGASLSGTVKRYFLPEQFTYLGISRNVQEGLPAYIEPLTASGNSIYPSAYYWFVGIVAKATGTNPLFSWNVVGAVSSVALLGVAGAWGRWLFRSPWGWSFAAVPFLAGTFQYFSRTWLTSYGDHAVLWGPIAILFNPGAEVVGLFLAAIALLCLVRGLQRDSHPLRLFAGAGAAIGLLMHVHTYCFLFAVCLIVLTLLANSMIRSSTRASVAVAITSALVSWAFVLSGVVTSALVLFAVVMLGFFVPLIVVPRWRNHLGLPLAAFVCSAGLLAAPMLLRFVNDATSEDSFLSLRAGFGQAGDLSLPVMDVIFHSVAVLVPAVFAITMVLRSGDENCRPFAASLIAVLGTGALMIFNDVWGMNQEPYRFFPYYVFFLGMVAVPFAARTALDGQWLGGTVMAALLVLTLPTTLLFAGSTSDNSLRVSRGERATLQDVASLLPEDGLTLTDRCIPSRMFQVLTGRPVVDFNVGLALPARFEAVQAVRDSLRADSIAPADRLKDAEVTAFLTMDYCNTAAASVLQSRFGAPELVPMVNPQECGLPAGTAYRIYKTADDDRAGATPLPEIPEGASSFVAVPGDLPPMSEAPCALGPTPQWVD